MRFGFREYKDTDAELVESWLDEGAVRETGLDEGWRSFYDYWTLESPNEVGSDTCFIISLENEPFAVMYIAETDKKLLISEYIVSPEMRGRGYGSAALMELLENGVHLLGFEISSAKAVIFPDNTASRRAFEKAGFFLASVHPDGDALNYEYRADAEV